MKKIGYNGMSIIKIILFFVFIVSANVVFAQTDSSYSVAKSIELRLASGADFCEMARLYSEDTQTKQNCGEIGFFGKGELMRGYEDAMVKLKIGERSDIVKTGYGYHIIQLVAKENKKYATRHILIRYR